MPVRLTETYLRRIIRQELKEMMGGMGQDLTPEESKALVFINNLDASLGYGSVKMGEVVKHLRKANVNVKTLDSLQAKGLIKLERQMAGGLPSGTIYMTDAGSDLAYSLDQDNPDYSYTKAIG